MSTSKDSFNSLAEIFNDPESLKILQSYKPVEQQEAKASNEVPALLREQAIKLTTEPFTGNPPHHGVSLKETLNTSLIRRFSDISYDLMSNELIKETETEELIKLSGALETFDVAKFEDELAAKKLAEQQAKAAKYVAQQSKRNTQEPKSKPTKLESNETAANEVSKSNQVTEVDVAMGLSPSLFLMSEELTSSQRLIYSTVNDFISLHHRIPQINAEGTEVQVAIFLKNLYEELPLACTQLLKYYIGVLPADDVELVKSQYSVNSPRPNCEVAKSEDDFQHFDTEAQTHVQPDMKSQVTVLEPAVKETEELELSKDAAANTEEPIATVTPVTSMDQAFKEAQELGLIRDREPFVKLKPRTYITSAKTPQSSSADGQISHFTKCSNFVQYDWIFKEIKHGFEKILDANGEKSSSLGLAPVTGKGNSRKINVGDVFYIKGTFYLIADIDLGQTYKTKHDREQARILVITDDGKQSTPFDTSFAAKFDKEETKRVVTCNDQGFQLEQKIKNYCLELLRNKPVKGYVYVLRTKSQNPVLLDYMQYSELLKIGFSTQPVAKRIANADKETTFLEAPVDVLYYVECYNYNPHTFEQLIHQVLDKRRLNIKLKSLVTGKVYQPKEWFTISLDVAREVIDRIMDGTIFDYHLNPINGRLELGSQNS